MKFLAFLLHVSINSSCAQWAVKSMEGLIMTYSRLKILLCFTVCFTMMFAPLLLDISEDGKAFAMGSHGNKKKKKKSKKRKVSNNQVATSPVVSDPGGPGAKYGEPGQKYGGPNIIHNDPKSSYPTPVPEPATWILFGAGAAGVAAFRKKFKRK